MSALLRYDWELKEYFHSTRGGKSWKDIFNYSVWSKSLIIISLKCLFTLSLPTYSHFSLLGVLIAQCAMILQAVPRLKYQISSTRRPRREWGCTSVLWSCGSHGSCNIPLTDTFSMIFLNFLLFGIWEHGNSSDTLLRGLCIRELTQLINYNSLQGL